MKEIIDNITIVDNGENFKIGHVNMVLNRKFIFNNTTKLHYSGSIILFNKLPEPLHNFLVEKEEYINTGVFSVVDDIDEKINRFNIFLEKSKAKIYDLYIENEKIDFTILV